MTPYSASTMTHLVHLAESVIDVDSAPQICEKDPLQLPIRWPAGKGLGMPSPYIDVIEKHGGSAITRLCSGKNL